MVTKHDWGMLLTSEVSETCYGIYDFWPWTNRTTEIKRNLRNRYFFQRWWLTERRPTPKNHIAHNVNLLHPLCQMGRAKVARRAPDRPKCSKKHTSQLPFACLKLRFSGKYLLSTGLWSVHSEYFPEKILAPPEIAPWIFPLNCCPSLHARQWGTK